MRTFFDKAANLAIIGGAWEGTGLERTSNNVTRGRREHPAARLERRGSERSRSADADYLWRIAPARRALLEAGAYRPQFASHRPGQRSLPAARGLQAHAPGEPRPLLRRIRATDATDFG